MGFTPRMTWTRVIGLMSGTSYDGIDVAAADLALDGDEVDLTPARRAGEPYDDEVRDLITRVLPPAKVPLDDVCRLDTLLGQAFAAAAARGSRRAGRRPRRPDRVARADRLPLGRGRPGPRHPPARPAGLDRRTHRRTRWSSDLRARDIARGGQGAPLVSVLDVLLLPPRAVPRAALNLGGIANMTLIRPDGTVARLRPGPRQRAGRPGLPALLRPAVRRGRAGTPRRGQVARRAAGGLLDEPYYAQPPPKSTGKELFHAGYLEARLAGCVPALAADDMRGHAHRADRARRRRECRTHEVGELIVSGGGVRNPWLMRRITDLTLRSRSATEPTVRAHDRRAAGCRPTARRRTRSRCSDSSPARALPATVPACTGASAPASWAA